MAAKRIHTQGQCRVLRTAIARRSAAATSAVLVLCFLGEPAARATQTQAGTEAGELRAHRLSVYVAPLGYGTFTGDFASRTAGISDVTINTAVFAASVRYGSRVAKGLELGAGLEFIKPYQTATNDPAVELQLDSVNATIYIRPYLYKAGSRLELGISGRIGIATGVWHSSIMGPGWTLGGGPDVRLALDNQWALGAELSLSAFQIREGAADAGNASLPDVNGVGIAVLPLFAVTCAF